MEDIRCLTFDLDDTLWPIDETIQLAEQALYEWFRSTCPKVSERYTLHELKELRIRIANSIPDLAHDITALREHSLLKLLKEFHYPETLVGEAMELFHDYRNKVSLFPDVIHVLQQLREQYILGVITNGNADVERIGLSQFFTFVTTAAQAGVRKPDPGIFNHAIISAQMNPRQIAHIGDDPRLDVLGAAQAGMRSIWLNRDRRAWPGGATPEKVIHTLEEIPALLGARSS
jgi:HAD superfamily hydrolase (TIGR01549 family)